MGLQKKRFSKNKKLRAYIIGLALGDGNLSNPNGRAVRLRITCDTRYPFLIKKMQESIKALLPDNKTSIVLRKSGYSDISCYSNKWEKLLGWRVGRGSKVKQRISVPEWIKSNPKYTVNCLRGLIETDGSIYNDRGYSTIMFASVIKRLAEDVNDMIVSLGFKPRFYKVKNKLFIEQKRAIYHVRIFREAERFLNLVRPEKNRKTFF